MLNYVWLDLIVFAVLIGGWEGHLKELADESFEMAEFALVKTAFPLIGMMAFWLGLMRLAGRGGLVTLLAHVLRPVLRRLFPDVPPEHPAMGSMVMNIAANMLGLGNAATPPGLRAMKDLETLNSHRGAATNAMCTFLAINTSSVQIVPVTTMAMLAANNSINPTAIFGTSLLATACAYSSGVLTARLFAKSPFFKLPAVAAAAILTVLLARADVQTSYWKDSVTLWTQALACTSDNAAAESGLGLALADQGKIMEAIRHYERALRLNPDYVDAHNNLGNALVAQGQPTEAVDQYKRSLRLNLNDGSVHNIPDLALVDQRKLTESIEHYEQALQSDPNYIEAHFNLGNALAREGNLSEAVKHFQQALSLAEARGDIAVAATIRARVKAYAPALPGRRNRDGISPAAQVARALWIKSLLINFPDFQSFCGANRRAELSRPGRRRAWISRCAPVL